MAPSLARGKERELMAPPLKFPAPRLVWLLALGILAGCSESSSPTGVSIDLLAGTWIGTYTSALEPTEVSHEEALKVVVRTEGVGTLTGYNTFSLSVATCVERVYFDFRVAPDGSLEGEGGWFCTLLDPDTGGYFGTGVITGFLDVSDFTGSGTITIGQAPDTSSVDWQVSKEVKP